MKRNVLLAAAAVMFALPAAAHHGWSEYDQNQALTLGGTIVESGYEHPHGSIRLKTPDKTWLVILAPPSRMESRGLPRSAIRVGADVTVVAYPKRDMTAEVRAERITADGKTIELR